MVTLDRVKEAVYQQTSYLSEQEVPELDNLLTRSKWDRRVRNVTPFYALFYQFDKWQLLTKNNKEVKTLELQLKKALVKLENQDFDTSLVAKELKSKYYPGGKTYVLNKHRDESDEMAKLLQSLVRSVNLTESLDEKTRVSVTNRLKNVDFNNLL